MYTHYSVTKRLLHATKRTFQLETNLMESNSRFFTPNGPYIFFSRKLMTISFFQKYS